MARSRKATDRPAAGKRPIEPYDHKGKSNFQPFVNKRDVKDGSDEDLTLAAGRRWTASRNAVVEVRRPGVAGNGAP